ncbi:ecotin family protein [Coraliomargarita sp. W4R72]
MKVSILVYLLAIIAISSGCASLQSNTNRSATVAVRTAKEASATVGATVGASGSDLKAFPLAEAGYQRHVFRLPALQDESAHFVTLVLGKTVLTDSVNKYMMLGSLEAVTVEGWGYTYYQLESEGHMAGTLMAVSPAAPQAERFIEVSTQLEPIRYNSKLPVVVIVPEGFEVKYQVWSAGELQTAPQE